MATIPSIDAGEIVAAVQAAAQPAVFVLEPGALAGARALGSHGRPDELRQVLQDDGDVAGLDPGVRQVD